MGRGASSGRGGGEWSDDDDDDSSVDQVWFLCVDGGLVVMLLILSFPASFHPILFWSRSFMIACMNASVSPAVCLTSFFLAIFSSPEITQPTVSPPKPLRSSSHWRPPRRVFATATTRWRRQRLRGIRRFWRRRRWRGQFVRRRSRRPVWPLWGR